MARLANEPWRQVIETWFPVDLPAASTELHHWLFDEWFEGGLVLPPDFAGLADAALRGDLDAWAATPRGRLALILLLDQVPRQLRAGTPLAFAGDADALALAEDGLRNGHYDALEHPWERSFLILPLAHAEGPDHRPRLIRLAAMAEAVAWSAPEPLRPLYRRAADRARAHQAVIERFGRFPHRNAVLGRGSTLEEQAYLATGSLPQRRRPSLPARLGVLAAGAAGLA